MNECRINPLIWGNQGEFCEDTASSVEGAIEFIADALCAIHRQGGTMPKQTAQGASALLMCCAAAIHHMRNPKDTGEQK